MKSPEIPSRGFLFAFAGASELFPFGANLNFCWNCPAGTLELIPFGESSDCIWDLQFPDIPSWGFLLVSPFGVYSAYSFVGNCIFPVGGLLFFSFIREQHVLGSGSLRRKMVNLKYPRKVESDVSLGQVMEFLVGTIQRYIIG